MKSVVIVDALRTPIGSPGGKLSSLSATDLGSVVIGALYKNNSLNPDFIDEVVMGQALQAGCGPLPARQSALKAGLKHTIPGTTINSGCASGMQAIVYAMQQIICDNAGIMVAGGMESMSNVPCYQFDSRKGDIQNGIRLDGLQDAFSKKPMGHSAELCAQTYNITRQEQDDHAIASCHRSQQAKDEGAFHTEITPVKVRSHGQAEIIDSDEAPDSIEYEQIPKQKPLYQKDGSVTTANSFKNGDGAAALLLMNEEKAQELGLSPMARLLCQTSIAQAPKWFTTAPARAVARVLELAGLSVSDMDLFEIHESYSSSTLANMKLLDLDPARVNVHGGAIGLGHPLGCSGARILTTLLHALKRHDKKRGCAAIAHGSGGALAMVVQRY